MSQTSKAYVFLLLVRFTFLLKKYVDSQYGSNDFKTLLIFSWPKKGL